MSIYLAGDSHPESEMSPRLLVIAPTDTALLSRAEWLAMHSDLAEVYTQLITSLRNLLACSGIAVLSLTEQGAVIPAQFGPKRLQHHIHLGKPEAKI